MAHGRVTHAFDFGDELLGHFLIAVFVNVLHVSGSGDGDLFQLVHLGQILIGPRRFFRVHFADREAHMHHDVFADLWIGNVLQAGFASDAAVIDSAHPHRARLL